MSNYMDKIYLNGKILWTEFWKWALKYFWTFDEMCTLIFLSLKVFRQFLLVTYRSLLSARCKLSVKSQTIKCLTIWANFVVLIGSKFPTYLFSPEGVVVVFNINRCTSLAYSQIWEKEGSGSYFSMQASLWWMLIGIYEASFKWSIVWNVSSGYIVAKICYTRETYT